MALACCCAQFTASALPFCRTTISGLPVAARLSAGLPARREDRCGAIAAAESVELDGHFFALEVRREADAGDDHVGIACAAATASLRRASAGACQVRSMPALPVPWRYSRRMGCGCGVVEVDRRIDRPAPRSPVFSSAAFEDELAIEIEPEAFGVFAGVAIVDADAELVVAGRGRGEGAGPAHRVVVALRGRRPGRPYPS